MFYQRKWEELFERFKMFFPCYADEVDYWYPEGPNQILCVMNDRGKIIYDDNTQSAFCVRYREDDLSDEEVYRKEFGNRLRNRIADRCMSQQDLSEMTGISTHTISCYVRGKGAPSPRNIVRLARALRCTTNELLYPYDELTRKE